MVLAQTYDDFELLICDDGSSDDTLERLKEVSDPRVTVLSFANRGPPFPLNEIIRRALREFVIILHDHDIFSPELIARSVQMLDDHPEANFVVQGSAWVAEDGKSSYCANQLSLNAINDGPAFAKSILRENQNLSFPLHACCMIRRASFERVGLSYEPRCGWYADIDLSFRLLRLGAFAAIADELMRFRTRDPQHVLTRDFRLTYNTLFGVFEHHTEIFFADDLVEMGKRLGRLREERRQFLSRAILHAFAHGDLARSREALAVARRDMPRGLSRMLVSLPMFFTALHPVLCRSAAIALGIHRRIRGRAKVAG